MFNELKRSYCDVNMLDFSKTAYELEVQSTEGLSLYDSAKIIISGECFLSSDGNLSYNKNEVGDNGTFIKEDEYNCVITSIGDNHITITTDYESPYYKYSGVLNSTKTVVVGNYEFNIDYRYVTLIDDISFDSCFENKIIGPGSLDNKNIIGDLSGEQIEDYGELSGHGLLIRKNGYFINPYINNEFKFVNLTSDYELNVPVIRDYSIKSNGFKVVLGKSAINGLIVNVYFTEDTVFVYNGIEYEAWAGEYIVLRNIPTEDNLIWVLLSDNQ